MANSEREPVCFLVGEDRNVSYLAQRASEVLLNTQRQAA